MKVPDFETLYLNTTFMKIDSVFNSSLKESSSWKSNIFPCTHFTVWRKKMNIAKEGILVLILGTVEP